MYLTSLLVGTACLCRSQTFTSAIESCSNSSFRYHSESFKLTPFTKVHECQGYSEARAIPDKVDLVQRILTHDKQSQSWWWPLGATDSWLRLCIQFAQSTQSQSSAQQQAHFTDSEPKAARGRDGAKIQVSQMPKLLRNECESSPYSGNVEEKLVGHIILGSIPLSYEIPSLIPKSMWMLVKFEWGLSFWAWWDLVREILAWKWYQQFLDCENLESPQHAGIPLLCLPLPTSVLLCTQVHEQGVSTSIYCRQFCIFLVLI